MSFLLLCAVIYWYSYERIFEKKYLVGKALRGKDAGCRAYYLTVLLIRLLFFFAFAFLEANLLLRFVSSYDPSSGWVFFSMITQFGFFICRFSLVLDWGRIETKPSRLSFVWEMLSYTISFVFVLSLVFVCFLLGFLGAISNHINTAANSIFYTLGLAALIGGILASIKWSTKSIRSEASAD